MQDALELPFPRPLSGAFVETLPSRKVPPRVADTMRDRGPSRRNRHAKEEDHQ